MKYRLICLILCFLLLSACSQPVSQSGRASFFYYYPVDSQNLQKDGVICSAAAENYAAEQPLREVLEDYLHSVVPENARSVIPESWQLQSVFSENATLFVVFSGSTASVLDASLSCTCLAKTLLQIDGIRRISVSVPGQVSPTVLTENDILLKDTGMLPQEELVVLYYPDAEQRYLVAQMQEVTAMDADAKPAYIMDQLLQSGKNTCIPEGTQLLDIRVENGVCTVNLSSAFEENMPQSFAAVRMAVYSIADSLTELPQITTVDLWTEGAPLVSLYRMDLSAGITRDESLIFTPSAKETADVTLYPFYSSDGLLPAIPMILEARTDKSNAELVLEALLSCSEKDGLSRCIPEGTKLLSMRMEGGNCVLDLTGEFLNGCNTAEEEELAVRSLIASLCTLPEIDTVGILVEGIEPSYRNSILGQVHQADAGWFAP